MAGLILFIVLLAALIPDKWIDKIGTSNRGITKWGRKKMDYDFNRTDGLRSGDRLGSSDSLRLSSPSQFGESLSKFDREISELPSDAQGLEERHTSDKW